MIVPILNVSDVDTSIAFYVHKLGFKLEMTVPDPDGNNVFGMVSLGRASIGLDQVMPGAPGGGAGVDLMVFVPDGADIDRVYADVQARGTAVATPLDTKYWGDRVFTVLDPDGYRITLSQTVKHVPVEQITMALRDNLAQ